MMSLVGDVEGRNVVLLDDIVDTAGTLTKAADLIMKNGASSVRAVVTHPILSGKAMERIENSVLEELIVTDTIPLKAPHPRIKVVSTAKLFAEVIKRLKNNESIAELFRF